jgi:hypothetical protein
MSRELKLQSLFALTDPSGYVQKIIADKSIAEAILSMEKVKGPKGEDGLTPIKGVDYFTIEEIKAIIQHIQSHVSDGKDGGQGERGEKGARGPSGDTPIRGIDYFTKEDTAKIIKDVISKIPRQKEVKKEEIKPVSYKDILDTPDLTDLPKVINFLKMGGFRGGGDTIGQGTGITINRTNGIAVISATSSGTNVPIAPTAGVINGINTVFTFAVPPKWLSGDGVNKFLTDNYTLVGSTVTFVDFSPPTISLYAFF